MKTAKVYLKSQGPYSQSKHHEEAKKEKESHVEYEERTWRCRMHSTADGRMFIPPMAFSNCLKESAKRMAIKIPGAGQRTYTKAFDAGLLVTEPLVLDVKVEEVPADRLFVPSDGVRGSGKRVIKYFGRVDAWEGEVSYYMLDETITEEVFARVARNAGALVGLGRFRPEKGGYYGRFTVESIKFEEVEF